jgi:8-oxo-dGTP diphosphatase
MTGEATPRTDYAHIVNVDAAVVRDGEYLLIERAADRGHAAGLLAFPGGKLEPPPEGDGEVEAAARREVAEEVGVEVGAVEYVCSNAFVDDAGTPCLNVVTHCEYDGGEAHPRAADEVAAVRWLSADELRAREGTADFLLSYLERVESFRDGA